MKFFVGSHRCLSSIVTATIMLSAVAVMGSSLILWSNSTFSSHQIVMESTFSDKINKLNEFLIIENVWFGQTPTKFVNITMNNGGSVWLNVTKIQLVTSSGSNDFLFANGEILPSKSNSTKISYNWVDNVPIDVIVTTARDSIYRIKVVP